MQAQDNIPSLDDIFADFDHPNPNINRNAFINMKTFWPDESSSRLIDNLNSANIDLKRKSVKALASFGKDIIDKTVELYFTSNHRSIRLSCLKILVIVASNHTLDDCKVPVLKIIDSSLKDESPEVVLTVISLLRQIGRDSLPKLKILCRDSNLLKAKAALSALIEMPDNSMGNFLNSLANDTSLDDFMRESVLEVLNKKTD